MELGRQSLVVVVVGGLVDVVKPLGVRTKWVLSPALPLLLHVQGEDGVRTGRLVVHVRRRCCSARKGGKREEKADGVTEDIARSVCKMLSLDQTT